MEKFKKTFAVALLVLVILNTLFLATGLWRTQKQMQFIQKNHIPLTDFNGIITNIDLLINVSIGNALESKKFGHLNEYQTMISSLDESLSQANEIIRVLDSRFLIKRTALTFYESEIVNQIKIGKYAQAEKLYKDPQYEVEKRLFKNSLSTMIEHFAEDRDTYVEKIISFNRIAIVVATFIAIFCFAIALQLIRSSWKNEKERKAAYQMLLSSSEQHRNMTRILSHDISTPLSLIIGYSNNAKNSIATLKPEDNEKYWNAVYTGAKGIKEIVEHVREFEALESGKKVVSLTAVSVTKVIDEINASLEKRLQEKNIAINMNNKSPEIKILGNETSIKHQIISNIMTNAIKFSRVNSKIDITIEEVNSKEVMVAIRDYGVGIPKELLDKLFDPIANTTRVGTSGEQGTGFGMPIMKSYIDKMNARIEVDSQTIADAPLNHGTCFSVYFKKVA